jgi:hypothetical protein
MTFEYFVVYFGTRSTHGVDFVTAMNELGAQGWELVGVSHDSLFFKRPIAAR